jgi:riboflavin kinase/FMN adenylyltransferase
MGTFDGVHAGHRAVVGRAHELAVYRGCGVLAVTFSPRPDEVLRPERALVGLMSLDQRLRRLRDAGADEVVVLPFDRELAAVTADEYLAELRDAFAIEAVCVGERFRFGRDRDGSPEFLRARGIEVFVPTTVRGEDGRKVSSSRLRESACRTITDNTPFAYRGREKASL